MRGAKRIVVLSDGTGNAASKVWRTNVWRVFEFLDLSGSQQVAKYDDGVGSSSFKPLALLGGAFGWGLKRNIIDLYKFVCRNYQPGDQIYAFGFSRGAFTVRVLIALILHQGLVPYISEGDLHRRAKGAYRQFRAERFHSVLRLESVFRKVRDLAVRLLDRLRGRTPYYQSANIVVPSIEFIGVWDTVAAYGLPIDEMTRGVSQWIWPLELPQRILSPRVKRACHALALDDERTTFHPVLWTEEGEPPTSPDGNGQLWLKDERLSQVWFTGMHSNVGGGYPDDALAHLPLHWIMHEAALRGLVFKAQPKADPDAFRKVVSASDKDGRMYDSRSGLGGYYRYGPRKLADLCNMRLSRRSGDAVHIDLPKIHESALARMRSDSNAYAPIGLPARYAVATTDGRLLKENDNPYETLAEAKVRATEQEKIWNFVWLRRLVYFATLVASFHLVFFWLFHDRNQQHEYSSWMRPVSEFVRLVEAFFPRQVVRWWTDWFAENPEWFLGGVVAVALLIWIGSRLGGYINDSMRLLWNDRPQESTMQNSLIHSSIHSFRTSKAYLAVLWTAKRHVFPFLSAVVLVWIGVTETSHLVFNFADSLGSFCRETPISQTSRLALGETKQVVEPFRTSSMCFPTKIRVERGQRYLIEATVTVPWVDMDFATDPAGFSTSELPGWRSLVPVYATVPQRRVFFRPWSHLIARVGSEGNSEYFLDSRRVADGQENFRSTIWRAERDGEVFLYVNEAVVPLPWVYGAFYKNNRGEARIEITQVE